MSSEVDQELERRVKQRLAAMEEENQKLQAELLRRRNAATADRFYASVVDQVSDAIIGVSFEGRVTFWNAAAEQRYGFTAEQAVGRMSRELFDYEYTNGWTDEKVGEVLLAGGEWIEECRHRTQTGRLFDVHVSLAVHRDEQGAPLGVLAVFRDITEQKRAREALNNSKQLFESFMNYSPALAYMKDEQGRYVYASAAFLRQTRFSREQVIGRTDADLWPGESTEKFRRDDQAVWHADQPVKLRYETNIAGYGVRHWLTYKFPVRDANGQRLIAGFTLDTTDQVNAENALRERERSYREASETNRRLLMELDHRVRNNLANLIGLIGLMRERATDVNVFADAFEARLMAMAHVHDLMAGTGYQPVELSGMVESLLRVAQGIASEPLAVSIHGTPLRVQAFQVLPLTMILLEWFTNSCKYGAGSVTGGTLEITWWLQETQGAPAGEPPRVHLRWRESGGPPITEPVVASLGTSLVHSFATRELHGSCELRYPTDGVDHEIAFPESTVK